MKTKHANVAITRRVGRKKSRVKVGARAFLFFAVLAVAIAAVAISLNLKVEERLWRHTVDGSG